MDPELGSAGWSVSCECRLKREIEWVDENTMRCFGTIGGGGAVAWRSWGRLLFSGVSLILPVLAQGGSNVILTEVPDYEWHAGCFGTASGNLMGYWDRHGFSNFYTGPTSNGIAPLNSFGDNYGIRSLWSSQAGLDGRPAEKLGHWDDYFVSYASIDPDPYITFHRVEHEWDCIGDFIGLNQKKWRNLDGECDGNIDSYSFVYWDPSGDRRINYTPGPEAGLPAVDIQSGLRAWTQFRGSSADVYTQLADLNPEAPAGKGFTFSDLKSEIDAGYPVLMFLQFVANKSREILTMSRANPLIHGVLAYGYFIDDEGIEYVRYRTSFAGGDNAFAPWKKTTLWSSIAPLRGVIIYHPRPQIISVTDVGGQLTIRWDGPRSQLYNASKGSTSDLHWYVIEKANSISESDYTAITYPTTNSVAVTPITEKAEAYYRVSLVPPPENLPQP